MGFKEDLLDQGMELRETHISQVFLGPRVVYKLKKPVNLGFLDFSTLELRKHFCEEEVRLNRRLAPSVYRGVLPITRDGHGIHHVGGSGEVVEWAVEMRRLRDEDSAEARLRDGRLSQQDLVRLSEHLARFHAEARCDEETSRFGDRAVIEGNVRENFEQTRQSARRALSAGELEQLERWQLDFLAQHGPRFEARVSARRIRDGHGDLRLEHCYFDDQGGVQIIDCIEFNDRFRYGDVCADIAFLSMDLLGSDRADLSEALLSAYARASDDYDLYGVVDFYESYRAFVRGKVSSMLEDDGTASSEARRRAATTARRYYLLSEACTREPLDPPALYAVGGMIAAGKSSVADALAELLDAPVLDADRTRKRLAGVDPLTPLGGASFAGHYAPETTERVYAELLRRAEVVLSSQRSVIVDASFRSRDHRRAARALARRMGVPFLFIECRADPAVCRERLVARARGPSISDGRLDVFDAFMASYQPVDELGQDELLRLDTSQPLDATLDTLRPRLPTGASARP